MSVCVCMCVCVRAGACACACVSVCVFVLVFVLVWISAAFPEKRTANYSCWLVLICFAGFAFLSLRLLFHGQRHPGSEVQRPGASLGCVTLTTVLRVTLSSGQESQSVCLRLHAQRCAFGSGIAVL